MNHGTARIIGTMTTFVFIVGLCVFGNGHGSSFAIIAVGIAVGVIVTHWLEDSTLVYRFVCWLKKEKDL